MDRLNVSRAVQFLGGIYEEVIQKGISVVICNKNSKSDRREGALRLGLPVVTNDWLLGCVRSYQVVPFDKYLIRPKSSSNKGKPESDDSISFETMRTLSVPSRDVERRISER
jgi:hypothetical protein